MENSRPLWSSIFRPVAQADRIKENISKKNHSVEASTQKIPQNSTEVCKVSEGTDQQVLGISRDEIEALQKEKSILETRLNEALKKLVTLQPRQETSDEVIKQLYEELCQNLEDFGDSDTMNVVNIGERITSVKWTSTEAATVFRHFTEDNAELSKLYPEINSNILMNMLFSWLFEMCLNEDKWCCNGRPQEEELLSAIFAAIKQQSPTSGGILSNRWRAETYLALSSLPDRMERRKQIIWNSNGLICNILNKLTDRPLNFPNFREKILNKAFKLAHLMKSSVTRYIFNFPPVSATNDVLLKRDQADPHRFLDAHTGIGIDTEALREDGEITGKLRLCVFPSLSKVQDDGSLVPMVKALVVLDRPKQLNTNETLDESGKVEHLDENATEVSEKLDEIPKSEEADTKPTEVDKKLEANEGLSSDEKPQMID